MKQDDRPMIDENGAIHFFRNGYGICDKATYEKMSGLSVDDALKSGALRAGRYEGNVFGDVR